MKNIYLDKIFEKHNISENCNNLNIIEFKQELIDYIKNMLIEQDKYWGKYLKKQIKETKSRDKNK